jgi:hypothetical protein
LSKIALIDTAVKHIKELPSNPDRQRYLRALRYALGDDGRTPPRVQSPGQIFSLTEITVESQYKFNIVLDRKRAVKFLASIHNKPSPEAFRKKLSAANYKKRFGKGPPARVGNSYVFTYQEILMLEGVKLNLSSQVPEEI